MGLSLTSGANVDELGGRGKSLVLGNANPMAAAGALELVCGDSSWISAIVRPGDLLCAPMTVGDNEIRTQF